MLFRSVAPGMVNTAFFDEAKPDKLQPEDVADAVVFALEARSEERRVGKECRSRWSPKQ